ncbi:MAG: DeoR/GlpR transcriptional regulator [Spirochaetales bacterium]|nr:DeoR/GlpR transcriptional regulator [Spirochaetales bacterium]
MTYSARTDDILKLLGRLRYISVQELTERLNVSEVTIRKDLSVLEEMGLVIRTRGGAELAQDSRFLKTITVRRNERLQEKTEIAKKACTLLRDGDTVFMDSGSTCMLMCSFLAPLSLRVVTNSIDVMTRLADLPDIQLVSVGGNYRSSAGSFLGPMAVEVLKQYQLETCFLGTTGFTDRLVFSSQNVLESQLKEAVLKVSSRRVILSDSSKYGHSAFSVFARKGDVDILVTDNAFTASDLFTENGIEVIIAP